MIYQARISLQTAALLEYLRQYFEQESGGFVSKGDVLNRAYLISGWTKKHDFDEVWNAIHNTPIPDIKTANLDLPENSNLIKVNIYPETHQFIIDIKNQLPVALEAQYVTMGVVIREILKSAYIVINTDYQSTFIKRNNFKFEKMIEQQIETKDTDLKMLIKEAQADINNILDNLASKLDELSHK